MTAPGGRSAIRRPIAALLALAGALLFPACSDVRLNQPLAPEAMLPVGAPTVTAGGYRYGSVPSNGLSPELLVAVAFSGGGTRSAALSYGVLKGLRDTQIVVGGEPRRLLDEISFISAVSCGSMIAAYYGLYRDRTFTDFERDFLRRDVNAEIYGLYLLPWNWEWLVNPYYGTNDAMQRLYDRHMYRGATYADLAQRGLPILFIQVTDISFGSAFSFSQDQFDLLCSDLSRVPVARAVAASAGVPVLFTPITLANHVDRCGGRRPAWTAEIETDTDLLSRRRFVAAAAEQYLDGRRARYVHLLDGGVADNLALRGMINAILLLGEEQTLRARRLERIRRILLISVDGQGQIDDSWAQRRTVTGLSQILNAATGTPMNQYNFETLRFARERIMELAADLRRVRCEQARTIDGRPCADVRSFFVQLGLGRVADPERRRRLQLTPTSLTLPKETIDELIALGESQVHASSELAAFAAGLVDDHEVRPRQARGRSCAEPV